METLVERIIQIKRYSTPELAELYETSKSTINRDLRPHREKLGKRIGHRWSIKQVIMIFELMGRP